MPTPEHNPQSIPPSQIPPGCRLCRESEREKLPKDAKFWDHAFLRWQRTAFKRICPAEDWAVFTYITATPLPESEREVETTTTEFQWTPLHIELMLYYFYFPNPWPRIDAPACSAFTRELKARGLIKVESKERKTWSATEAGDLFVKQICKVIPPTVSTPAASPWIPMSERSPHESDFPVFLYADEPGLWSAETQVRLCYHWSDMTVLAFKDATHWQPAATKLPAPPPPTKSDIELLGEELIEAFKNLTPELAVKHLIKFRNRGIDAALETERARFGGRSAKEVATKIMKILEEWCRVGKTGARDASGALCDLLSPPGENKHE